VQTKEQKNAYCREYNRKKRIDPAFRAKRNKASLCCYYKNPDKYRALSSAGHKRRKLEVLTHYCGETPYCQCPSGLCDVVDLEFLTIDHINNNGAEHRKLVGGMNFYRWLQKNNYPEGFRVLCYNCNCGRFRNKGICPHEKHPKAQAEITETLKVL